MNRKIKHTVLITMMLCVSLVSQAYDFKDGDCYYTITSLSEQTVALTNSGEIVSSDGWHTRYAACYGGDFVVPQTAEYLGKIFKVTSIDDKAFQDCNLDKLTIPSTVISASIEGVIQNLIIEDGDTPLSKLEVVRVKKEVYVGRDIVYVYGFSGLSSSIEKIVFGGSATYVPGGMLERSQELVNVELSNNIKAILEGAFRDCTKLKTISGSSVEHIERRAFSGCTSLESFNFPNLKTIGGGDGPDPDEVFQGCTSLKSVILPQGLARIGEKAFMNCTSLESITIPASIVFIGQEDNIERSSVFTNCPLLKNITINGLEPIAIGETTFDAQTYINATLKIPVGTKDKYMAARNWKNFFTMEEDANINDDIFSVLFDGLRCDCYVEANGKKIKVGGSTITARKGESITLKFIPRTDDIYGGDDLELESVKVNGVDVTRNVVGNELVIEVTGNMTVDMSWTETDEPPVFLSIKQADNGNVKLKVSKWDEYKVIFEPAEGWKIHSVTFNGTDVTNELSSDNSYRTPEITENSELIVAYVSSTNAIDGIRSEQPSPKVVGSSGCIVISEAEEGQTVYAYTTAGVLVDTAVTHNGTTTIRVQENEVYIVKVGNKTFKVGM